MYKDKVNRCPKCGNETPVVPLVSGPCRECGHDDRMDAFAAALGGLDGMTKRGVIGTASKSQMAYNKKIGWTRPVIYS